MTDKSSNNFVRALIVGLSGFILWIIAYSFLSLEPKGTISTGIITLIVLLVVIVLSESFDNFRVGKMLTMSREIKAKDSSINKLNSENTELRKELVNVVTSISQHQSSTNIIGFPGDLAKNMGVEKATEEEITKKRSEENEESTERSRPVRRRINLQKLEELAFAYFLQKRNLTDFDLIKEAKLVTQFSGIDAVSNIQPIYDGYINTGESEIFVEVKVARASSIMMRERVYMMLNKIYLYNKVKKANAHLNLLLVDIDSEGSDSLRSQRNTDRLKEFFEPSIVNGLLRIVPIELNVDEIAEVFTEE
ncbi:hypothetical protein [Pseudoalteromonas sp. BDTF-M6]|uniref:hypothetical protein n=1 Tax=Pseudoalteromonas sp. BDTF-M6 TaxID=2796132 RepID=UPI001BAE5CDB|nr:hypothetical protein [Pseudoalteromonas sp. BDTF-M6]MBS3798980.1 hypothetical protein [Pseudoalteromonas sp. BDTF-M6]